MTVCRPQIAHHTRALEDGRVDAARCDAIADRVQRRAAIPARTGDRVGRATAHRQDDGVHAVDAALGTREHVGDDDGRALDGDQCRVRRQRHALAEQARVVLQICTLPLYRLC